ncbi:MAG: hypothetical protein A2W68_01800 [Betaproteobacteria bacterium RIFCSPLOWO2_02_64_14]|nr:MAG: hypothetical protein A2W68_01800 [Betaproteobacteria bacterium RIFCSPLOWO2_02_64_14]
MSALRHPERVIKENIMSYEIARKAFEEIKDSIKPPARDPVHWQCAHGMVNLVTSIEADMQDVRKQLQHIQSLVISNRR